MGTHFRVSAAAGVLAVVWFVGGCTAIRGVEQKVSVVGEEPEKISVRLTEGSGEKAVVTERVTPFEKVFKRREKYRVVASAPGYQAVEFEFYGRVDLAAAIPVALPAGSVMMATDVATGANKEFSKRVRIKLMPLGEVVATGGATTGAATQPVFMREWKGVLYTPEAYEKQIEAELKAIREQRPVNSKTGKREW